MRININNQAKVGLTTVVCLLSQGYIFTYILKVEPHPLISFIPLLPYIAYIYTQEPGPGSTISRCTG